MDEVSVEEVSVEEVSLDVVSLDDESVVSEDGGSGADVSGPGSLGELVVVSGCRWRTTA